LWIGSGLGHTCINGALEGDGNMGIPPRDAWQQVLEVSLQMF